MTRTNGIEPLQEMPSRTRETPSVAGAPKSETSATTSRPRRVLIIGINYAPEHSGIAPYTTDAAEYLAARGNRVQVVAGVPHYPNWSVPEKLRHRLSTREHCDGVEIRRLRHFVPATQSAGRRGLYELSFASQVLARRHIENPDVVLAVVPSLLSAVAAAQIARRSRARLVIWIQDYMSAAADQSGMSGGQSAARIVSKVERYLMHVADSVVIVSEDFRKHAVSAGAGPDKVVLIKNWSRVTPSVTDRASTRARFGWGAETVALHAGNMGLKQGLENVVAAARRAAEVGAPVRFVLLGDGSQRRNLRQLAEGVPTLDLVAPVPAPEFSDVLDAADVLLVNESARVSDMSLPSKLTSYFMAGRPVVAAVSPTGGTAREICRSGAGLVVPSGQPELLLEAILALRTDPTTAITCGARGREYAELMLSSEASLRRLSDVLNV